MLSILLLLAVGSSPFTVETGTLQLLDAGSTLPAVALQPASATWNVGGTTEPVVVWRDNRLGAWVLTAATPEETQIIAIERDGELSSPQVTSSLTEWWFAWEVALKEGKAVRVCSRSFFAGPASVSCLRPTEYPDARLPRFRTNGHGSGLVRLGLVRPDGGVTVDPLANGTVPQQLPFVAGDTIDYSFIDPIATGFGILVQSPGDGGTQISFNGTFVDYGSQPNISANSFTERMWVDSTGVIRRAAGAFSPVERGNKPWSSGVDYVWLSESGQLRISADGTQSTVQPPFDSRFIDHATWKIAQALGVVLESRNGAGLHALELISGGPSAVAPMDLVRETVAGDPRGSMNQHGASLVAWRSPLGLELAIIEGGSERTHVTRHGAVHDFAVSMIDEVGTLALIADAGAVVIEHIANGAVTSVNLSQGILPSSEVATADNGEVVQLGAAGPLGVSLFSEGVSPKVINDGLMGGGSNLRVDCLWKSVCAATWQSSTGITSMRMAPSVVVPIPPLGEVVGLTHDERGFVVVLEDETTTAVVRVSPDAAVTSELTMRLPGEHTVVLPGTPPVLVWQIDDAVRAMRLDTFEQISMSTDRALRLRDGAARRDVGHQDQTVEATLLFETRVLDAVYALPVRFKFGDQALDAGTDAGMISVDAGQLDAGSISSDAGANEDGGVGDAGVDARPTEFKSCGCTGSPSWLGAALLVTLFARRRGATDLRS